MLSGSVALSIYTLPRATRNFDFIVHLQQKDVSAFVQSFKEGYYCDEDAINDAIVNKGLFNIIDHASGFKADFVILKDELFRQTEFNRRIEIDFYGMPVYVVSPEDLLLSKLIWLQQYKSGIQIEDVKALNLFTGLNREYIQHWVSVLKLNTFDLLKTNE